MIIITPRPRGVDLNIKDLDIKAYDEDSLRSVGAKFETGQVLAAQLAGRTIRGRGGGWNFIRHFSRSGEVRERIWRQGLMRLWARKGPVFEMGDALCISFPSCIGFPSYPQECIARAYEMNGVTYLFSEAGALIAAVTWFPADFPLPVDLAH